jgi:hypothetical protein
MRQLDGYVWSDALRIFDKCHHIVDVKKCQEIVNEPMTFASCHTGTEILNALLWGDTGGEAYGHNHDHRQIKLCPRVKRPRCDGTFPCPRCADLCQLLRSTAFCSQILQISYDSLYPLDTSGQLLVLGIQNRRLFPDIQGLVVLLLTVMDDTDLD